MKADGADDGPPQRRASHPWMSFSCVILGLGIFALAVFWIRRCRYFGDVKYVRMFNLYQNINKKEEDQNKEPQVIGHERFYQERTPRSSSRKKKRTPRRTHSAAEFPAAALCAATKRAAFRARSHSSETKSDGEGGGRATPVRVDSLAKVFFGNKRQSGLGKHEYSAVKTDGGNEKYRGENKARSIAFATCKRHLSSNTRYVLNSQLGDIGARPDKHWFTVQDNILGAERLLTLVPLPSTCPISPSSATRETMLDLFRGLQHPYIHPILDVEFWDDSVATITPLNPAGSLRDLIYGGLWHEDFDQKYINRGEGLPMRTLQCLGRQIIEGLLFLKSRHFPPVYHLHAGNVIIQNGVARLAALENALLGFAPRAPAAPETLALGHLLFEMAAGYGLGGGPPAPAHLQLELERAPQVAAALELIFQPGRTPSLEEVIRCDLFRGVELRELRGATIPSTVPPPDVLELLDLVMNPVPPSPLLRRKDVVVVIEEGYRKLEDILEEDNENSDSSIEDPPSEMDTKLVVEVDVEPVIER